MNGPTAVGSLDPEIVSAIVSRREAIFRGASVSTMVAAGLRLASAPVALAALSREAFGQAPPAVITSVLNFALTLEYLEAEFYNLGLAATGLIPPQDRKIFTTIAAHENAHVAYLMNALGGAAVPKPTFDYSAGNGSGNGPFATVFTNYATFMAVAQAFEDTGVRAYKGQAPRLIGSPAVLEAALSIHSVEARHAAEVRRLRGNYQELAPNKGWITGAQTDIPGTAAVYAGEDRTVQLGVDITAFVSASAASEAFDEALSMKAVLAIVDPFIV